MKSKVMTIANHLVKQGMSRSAAMVQAWITVKLRNIVTRAAGVTHGNSSARMRSVDARARQDVVHLSGNRQMLLHRLSAYNPEQVSIELHRERENRFDSNAVKIIAAVSGKGKAALGYLNRSLAAVIAPLLDKGKQVISTFRAVTGGESLHLTYGLSFELTV